MSKDSQCIFCKIVHGELPAKLAGETTDCLAFYDVNPAAPVHILIVPKRHVLSVFELGDDMGQMMSRMLQLSNQLVRELTLETDGFRLVINTGKNAGQSVGHIHMHLLGGRELSWPPG